VKALAAGDTWLDKATDLLLFGPPGTCSHCASVIGRALIENGFRVLFNPHQGYRAEAAGGSLRAALTGVRECCIACACVMFSPNECLVWCEKCHTRRSRTAATKETSRGWSNGPRGHTARDRLLFRMD
jgi:hypothetical protein